MKLKKLYRLLKQATPENTVHISVQKEYDRYRVGTEHIKFRVYMAYYPKGSGSIMPWNEQLYADTVTEAWAAVQATMMPALKKAILEYCSTKAHEMVNIADPLGVAALSI